MIITTQNKYALIAESTFQMTQLFSTSLTEKIGDKETEKARHDIIKKLKFGDWDTDPTSFYHSFKKAKHAMMLTPYTIEDFKQMKTFKLQDYDIGFALKEFNGEISELVAVHNASSISGIGHELVDSAIIEGAKYLDHFDGFLSTLYEKTGFIEYKRDPYNPMYDPNGIFASVYGKSEVIYRRYKTAPIPKEDIQSEELTA